MKDWIIKTRRTMGWIGVGVQSLVEDRTFGVRAEDPEKAMQEVLKFGEGKVIVPGDIISITST